MNKEQLQLTLKKHGLKTEGNKKQLIKRLNSFKQLKCTKDDFPHRQRTVEYMLKLQTKKGICKDFEQKDEKKELFKIPIDTSLDHFRMLMDTSEDD